MPSDLFYRASRKLVDWFFRIFYRYEIYGKEHFPKGKAIIAGNHVSYFDPPFIGVAAPEVIHYFARPSLFDKPVLGFLLRSYNVHPLPPDSPTGAIKLVSELLKKGYKTVIFPEGTRSYEDRITDPKYGVAMIAQRSESPIVPAYVGGAYEIWNRRRKWPKLTGKLICVFGSPLPIEKYRGMDKKEAQKALLADWQKAVEGLRCWYEEGAVGSPP